MVKLNPDLVSGQKGVYLMAKKATVHHPSFKFKVLLESFVKGNVAEAARKYGINPNQLSSWRKQFLEKGQVIFQAEKSSREKQLERKIETLENLIGKKEVEINLLKRSNLLKKVEIDSCFKAIVSV